MRRAKSLLSRFEQLEDRRLLAGDVRVFAAGSDLVLHGDSHDNHVEIRLDDSGNVAVFGVNGTTVSGEVNFEGNRIPDDLRVYLGSGDDSVRVEGIDVGDDVILVGQRGDDALGIYNSTVGDDLRIYGSSGDSAVSVDSTQVGDDLAIYTQRGSDLIGIDQSSVQDYTFVYAGSGDDTVFVRDSQHEGIVNVILGSGSDFLGIQGTGNIEEPMFIDGPAFVTAGSGNDDIFVNGAAFDNRAFIFGNRGSDLLDAEGNDFGRTPRTFSISPGEVDGAAEAIDMAVLDLVASKARLGTITELALLTPDLSELVGVLVASQDNSTDQDLVATLNSPGNFTVFAPINSAFEDLFAFLEENNISPSADDLVDILLFHVSTEEGAAGGPLTSSDVIAAAMMENGIIPTLNGDLAIDNELKLNGEQQVGLLIPDGLDIRAKNGIVHLIDGVLLPPAE